MRENKVIPWWGGFFLRCSLRNKVQDPYKILRDYVKPDMVVADVGSGMGYFTFPMAEMVGGKGKVVAVDLQQQMINEIKKKAKSKGELVQLEAQLCNEASLKIDKWKGRFEFVLAFAIAHEVPDRERFFAEIVSAMKKGGRLLFSEPVKHVSEACFNESLKIATESGLKIIERPKINLSRSVLLEK